MDEDPSNETFVLSLLEGCAADGVENMETEPAPARRICGPNTSPGSIEGTSPQIGSRLGASPGKPSRPLWSTACCINAMSGVLQRCTPIPHGRELIRDIHAGLCGHHAAPHTLVGNAFRQGFIGPLRSLMPMRSCAPARGANFKHASPISQLKPYKLYPSHGHSPCGG
jgi:hypothetical protein